MRVFTAKHANSGPQSRDFKELSYLLQPSCECGCRAGTECLYDAEDKHTNMPWFSCSEVSCIRWRIAQIQLVASRHVTTRHDTTH